MGRAQKIDELTSALLSLVIACSRAERGVMDSFHGDHFTITFNASQAVAGPLVAAVRTANEFIKAVNDSSEFAGCNGSGRRTRLPKGEPPGMSRAPVSITPIAAGAAVGRASVGTLGIDGYRRVSVIGEVYRNACGLQQAAVQFLRMNGTHLLRGGGCLVDEPATRELGSSAVHLQLVGCLQPSMHRAIAPQKSSSAGACSPPPPTALTKVYFAHAVNSEEANAEAKLADGEWLYELDAIESTNPYIDPNRALAALIGGDLKLCSELLATSSKTNTDQQAEPPQESRVVNQSLQVSNTKRNKSTASFDFGRASFSANGGSGSLLQLQAATPWDLVAKHLGEVTSQSEIMSRLCDSKGKSGSGDAVIVFTNQLSAAWLAFLQ